MAQLVEALRLKAPGVAVLIPGGVTGIFHRLNPSARTMAMGSTQLHEYQYRHIGA